jgi:hypothetical protein
MLSVKIGYANADAGKDAEMWRIGGESEPHSGIENNPPGRLII